MGHNIVRINLNEIISGLEFSLDGEIKKIVKPCYSTDKQKPIFVSPQQVISYNCTYCKKGYPGPPKVEVTINGEDEDSANGIVSYICKEGHTFLELYIRKELLSTVNPELVVSDETGIYKIPTPKDIEELFSQAQEEAGQGDGHSLDGGNYLDSLKLAQRFAQRISYVVKPEIIPEINQCYRTAYLKKFRQNLPELIETILSPEEGCFQTIPLYDDDEFDFYIHTPHHFHQLMEVLPHLDFSGEKELQLKVYHILTLFEEKHIKNKIILKKEKERIITEIELQEKIPELALIETKQAMGAFADRCGLSLEERVAARKVE